MTKYKLPTAGELTDYIRAFFGRIEDVSLLSANKDTCIHVFRMDEIDYDDSRVKSDDDKIQNDDKRVQRGPFLLKCFIPLPSADAEKINRYSELFSKENDISTLLGTFYSNYYPRVFASGIREMRSEAEIPSAVKRRNLPKQIQFMLAEYIEGTTLREFISKNSLLFKEKVDMALHIARGIHYLHSYEGMTHQDIKPENIVINFNGNPRIIDLGIADFIESVLCKENIITPLYCSPEQARQVLSRKTVYLNDPRTDVFSFGLLLYELITGRHIHSEIISMVHIEELFSITMSEPPKYIEPTGIPDIDTIVRNSTCEYEKRYPNMLPVIAALEEVKRNILGN